MPVRIIRTAILDHRTYPEIVDGIIRYASPQTLRALRLSSRGLRYAIDRRYQSLYRIWGHRGEHPMYRRRTHLLLASLTRPVVHIIEEFTGRPNPGRKALMWRSPLLSFSELNFATLRPHIFFVFPHLAGYADFDPQNLYTRSPLSELVRLIAASSLVDGTMWLFVGVEEWNERLTIQDAGEGMFYEYFLDAIARRRNGAGQTQEVTDESRQKLNAVVCATTRTSWKEWSRAGLVLRIEMETEMLLAERPFFVSPGSMVSAPFPTPTSSPYRG